MLELAFAVLTAALVAIVTKWVAAGGRARRWRTELREELDLLEALTRNRPGTRAVVTLKKQVDERAADYLRFTGLKDERIDGRISFGLAALALSAALLTMLWSNVLPTEGTWSISIIGAVSGVAAGALAIAIEPAIRAVRRSRKP